MNMPDTLQSILTLRLRRGSGLACAGLFGFGYPCSQNRLEPCSRATPSNPTVCCGGRASEMASDAGSTEFQAVIPVHDQILARKKKYAMRK